MNDNTKQRHVRLGGREGDGPGDLQEEPGLHDEGVRAGPREGPQVEGVNNKVVIQCRSDTWSSQIDHIINWPYIWTLVLCRTPTGTTRELTIQPIWPNIRSALHHEMNKHSIFATIIFCPRYKPLFQYCYLLRHVALVSFCSCEASCVKLNLIRQLRFQWLESEERVCEVEDEVDDAQALEEREIEIQRISHWHDTILEPICYVTVT